MIPNMKFYVVSIVAIFTALGLGIYIGFSMDTEGFITDQQENLVSIVETQFESIIKENKELTLENDQVRLKNKEGDKYIDESYSLLVPDKLKDKKLAIVESNTDYASSALGYDIEEAGGLVTSLTTIRDLSEEEVRSLSQALIKGDRPDYIKDLIDQGKIEGLGNYSQAIDYIVLAGGSKTEEDSNVTKVDKNLISVAKDLSIKTLGVEKSYVGNSYISKFKEYGISTVDNINMKMGKIASVLAFDAREGNYGIKGNAESILPIR